MGAAPSGCLKVPPSIGDRVELRVRHPFAADVGEEFHALFEPGWVGREGWEGFEAQLPQMAMVTAILRADLCPEETSSAHRVRVEVSKVIPIGDFCDAFPPGNLSALETCVVYGPAQFRHFSLCRHGPLSHLSWSAQGDVGGWLVFRQSADGGGHLLMAGEWGMHLASAYAGCALVSAADWERLLTRV